MTQKFLSLMTAIMVFSVSVACAMEDKAERRLDPDSRTPHVLRTPGTITSAPIPAEAEDKKHQVVANQAVDMNSSGVSRTPVVLRGASVNPHVQMQPKDK
ncbi:MAG: hypothetical protein K2P93_04905 [Alphaproteobacteria bacterium]|nr:hypothetical protein [Alphaproteobacteria bacterium]